jgi:hypothetical protein
MTCPPRRPDERDEVVPSQDSREIFDKDAAWHFHVQVLDRDHLIATAFSDFKIERHCRRIARRRRETRQALQSLPLALCLKRVDARDVAPDVLLSFFTYARCFSSSRSRERRRSAR